MTPIPAPLYVPPPLAETRPRVGFAVESMRRHTTDEGYQLFAGLEAAWYGLCGFKFAHTFDVGGGQFRATKNLVDVREALDRLDPSTVVVQDEREWQGLTAGPGFDDRERFQNVGALRDRPDVFRGTVLKDAHRDPEFHRRSAEGMGAHFWVTYYHDDAVCRLAPYVRREHLVRTYHTVDADAVPTYRAAGRSGCLLSGAASSDYPLRRSLFDAARRGRMPGVTVLPHPGYRRDGCHTTAYLQTLSRFKVAICTASAYQYLLRKVIEATACGCVVVTNLREKVPVIDANLIRVQDDDRPDDVLDVVVRAVSGYDPARQSSLARAATLRYDFRSEGVRLAAAIESLRRNYRC